MNTFVNNLQVIDTPQKRLQSPNDSSGSFEIPDEQSPKNSTGSFEVLDESEVKNYSRMQNKG